MSAKLQYEQLQHGQIRLLELVEQDAKRKDSGDYINCRLRRVDLVDFTSQAQNTQPGNTWMEVASTRYNFANLFSGVLARSAVRRYRAAQNEKHAAERNITPQALERDLSNNYLALSYVWGNSAAGKRITVNDVEHSVTDNLFAALMALKSSNAAKQGVKIWADAICINQDDLEERAQQVQLMQHIYASAWQVVIWLGPESEFTELAFTSIRFFGSDHHAHDDVPRLHKGSEFSAPHLLGFFQFWRPAEIIPVRNEAMISLWHFFSLGYWRRLWILQEAALARPNAPILWGSHCISVKELKLAVEYINSHERWLGRSIACAVGTGMPLQLRLQDFTRDRDLDHRDSAPGRLWILVRKILSLSTDHMTASNVINAFETLDLARNAGAKEERDKVFAILGLPAIRPLVHVVPDYHMPIPLVYKTFAARILESGDLNVLRLVQAPLAELSVAWLFKHEPLWLSKRLRLTFHNPLWPPNNFAKNLDVLKNSVTGANPFISAIQPCIHQLPSWTVCWTCASAPVAPFPTHYHADEDFETICLARPTINNDILQAHGVFTDIVQNLSSFHGREYDSIYPRNADNESYTNAYQDKAGIRDALWRTLLADTFEDHSPATANASPILLARTPWIAAAQEHLFRMASFQFGLPEFLRRNSHLLIGGHRFDDLLDDVAKPWQNARQVVSNEASLTEYELVSRATNLLVWRRLIGTKAGRIGLVPAATRQHDRIVILKGCGMPLVLRPKGDCWVVIGECYLHGIMRGEVGNMVKTAQLRVEAINIC